MNDGNPFATPTFSSPAAAASGAGVRPQPAWVVGVKQLSAYLRHRLEGDPKLRILSVRGEVSNYKPSPGYCYFDLKEGDTLLKCFAWPEDACRFTSLANGTKVIASGSISTYGPKSVYQLVVRMLEAQGVGDVHALFEERKKRLDAEGLFALERKRPLPRYPFRVALVSSRGANGALDFTTILRERSPHVEVIWCETPVQGPGAPPEIVAALRRASRADVDLIVLTRGGGSFEDLFAFSDEAVVRAVAHARHPVISAIGHTADQQLCDYAADRHVETPTAAAKIVGRDAAELRSALDERMRRARTSVALRAERLSRRLDRALVRSKLSAPRLFLAPVAQRLDDAARELTARAQASVRAREMRLRELVRRLERHDPSHRLAERERVLHRAQLQLDVAARAAVARRMRRVEDAVRRFERASGARHERAIRRLEIARARLQGNDPTAILQRGYAIVTLGGTILRDPATAHPGERIEARLARGTLRAQVEDRSNGNDGIG